MALSDNDIKLVVAASAAISAIAVAVVSAVLARVFAQRDRRRQMYGEAFRAALEWHEMVYRVRRRDNNDQHERELINKFHDLQERLDYYEGWIGSESQFMRRSYCKLVSGERDAVFTFLREAWDKPGKKGNADPSDTHPKIDTSRRDAFLQDVRNHLSLQPWRWPFVCIRNWSNP